jgi:hypothetical protein
LGQTFGRCDWSWPPSVAAPCLVGKIITLCGSFARFAVKLDVAVANAAHLLDVGGFEFDHATSSPCRNLSPDRRASTFIWQY